ncbi:hypothetical protein [Shinella sp.]|uniref:hypothetical protein n=1 Tax=Shinella sp. TaxID=1870904 RepID=UPI0028B062D2|nr:hypothetical protein [Shinella sp.]
MAQRVFIGRDSGGQFRFRASLPGYDALGAADQNLTIREGMAPLTPKQVVTVAVSAGGSATVNLGISYSVSPFMVLKASDNTLPGADTFYARLTTSSGQLTVYNRLGRAVTVQCFIFDEVIF